MWPAGGKVENKRALGDLIPSRSIGDFKTKDKCKGAVIAEPQVCTVQLTKADKLLLASDGLWDDVKVRMHARMLSRRAMMISRCRMSMAMFGMM